MDDLRPVDADNHYYETLDAFTRHLDPAFARRGVQAAQVGKRTLMVMGGRVNQFIPNPTFDPVTKPGCLDLYFRGQIPEGQSRTSLMELAPLAESPEYQDRDARLARLDAQGLSAAVLYPTMGVGVEEALRDDIPAMVASVGAFNRWLEDDWGYAYRNRLFAAPMVSLADPAAAVREIDRVLALDARIVVVRPAPVPVAGGGSRSLGHPSHDPVWARLSEAGVPVAFHLSDSGYNRIAAMWGAPDTLEAFNVNVLAKVVTNDRAISDSIASMIVDGVLTRFPALKVVSIENGSNWVGPLLHILKKTANQYPQNYGGDPVEQFRNQVWVAPYYEEDIAALVARIGAERVLFGSDWPHAEGLTEPLLFEKEIAFADEAIKHRIMRQNMAELIGL
jgi:predicted TIM-barrel fold metal-dependent hydrolase